MKKVLGNICFFAAFLILCVACPIWYSGCLSTPSKESAPSTQTEIVVVNTDTVNSVNVWLTIGYPDTTNWVSSVSGIFGITTSGGQAMFTLSPGQKVYYSSPAGKGIQGNISFLSAPNNCPIGTTLCEFCLNNYSSSVPDPQETVEISCVSGVSFIASIDLKGGTGIWTANSPGYDTILHIQNDTIGANSGLAGVYPFGCDDCISQSSGAPSCTIGINEPPQVNAICNVQRGASSGGGKVTISYIRTINQ